MPGGREDLPASGAETDTDLTPEFTYDEWMSEILDDLGDCPIPRPEDGWRTISEIVEHANGLSETQIRSRIKKLLAEGKYESTFYGSKKYYRPKKK